MSVTLLQRAEESLHYIQKFTEYLARGVFDGDPENPHLHTYAIRNLSRPDSDHWQPTSTAPRAAAFYADQISDALNKGQEVGDLPQIRRHFETMASTLKVAELYVGKDPKWERNARESIDVAAPAIQNVITAIDREFKRSFV